MYIGQVEQDFDVDVFERHYSLAKGNFYLAKDGILYHQLKGNYCRVIKEVGESLRHRLEDGYLVTFKELDKELHIAIFGAESWLNKIESEVVKEPISDLKQESGNGNSSKSKKRRNDA